MFLSLFKFPICSKLVLFIIFRKRKSTHLSLHIYVPQVSGILTEHSPSFAQPCSTSGRINLGRVGAIQNFCWSYLLAVSQTAWISLDMSKSWTCLSALYLLSLARFWFTQVAASRLPAVEYSSIKFVFTYLKQQHCVESHQISSKIIHILCITNNTQVALALN
jgi:hypothetical protein